MKTIEEKAKAYTSKFVEIYYLDEDAIEVSYIAGAKEALASQWRSVEEKPEHKTVAVVSDRYDNTYVAVYNAIYNQWCSAETQRELDVRYWMPIPEKP